MAALTALAWDGGGGSLVSGRDGRLLTTSAGTLDTQRCRGRRWLLLAPSVSVAVGGMGPAGALDWDSSKLQTLVYDILPSTSAVFSYVIGSRKLSANEQFFCCWCSNRSKFVTDNSNYVRRLFYN